MQPSTKMIKILVFRNYRYSVFNEPHSLKKLRGNLRAFILM